MQVPSTPTFADRQKEHKKISEEIAVLMQQKETLTSDVKVLVASREEMRKKLGASPEDYKAIEDKHHKKMSEHQEKEAQARGKLSSTEKQLGEAVKNLQTVQLSITTAEMRLGALSSQEKTLTDAVTRVTGELKDHQATFDIREREDRQILLDMRTEIDILRTEKAKTLAEIKERHNEAMKEEEQLSIKRADLEIYEDRMRKKYPNETFIV